MRMVLISSLARMHKNGFILSAVLAGWSATAVAADDSAADGPGDEIVVTAARDSYAPPETATATRTATPLRDVPQSVGIVSRQLIEDGALLSMADVVRFVPGVTIGQGEGHRDQPTLRGNNSTADFFVDGVRDDAQYFRDLYNSERVEVLKGPNAMIFGRGGGGGVINRVTKRAAGTAGREVSISAGSFDSVRGTSDLDFAIGDGLFGRLNNVYERGETFRDGVDLRRYGVNPTLGWAPGEATRIDLGLEYFDDRRTVDRGVPSFGGRPILGHRDTFFGDPDQSRSRFDARTASLLVEHRFSPELTLRNRSLVGDYDKFYTNIFPGAVNAAGTAVSLSAYNNLTKRQNLFNQTDLVWRRGVGEAEVTLLAGGELGRQRTDNRRLTGYFEATGGTSLSVPLADPTVAAAVTFRASASDADNRVRAGVAAGYLQAQIDFGDRLILLAGGRYDRVAIRLRNNRTGLETEREDGLFSPRAAVVFKPLQPLSLYASYSRSFLPSAGDQFSSLSVAEESLEPERFDNIEVGAKWQFTPRLLASAALYQLDRTNTRTPGPVPGQLVQTGEQRSRGFEFGLTGRISQGWEIAGGYALQNAEIRETTSAAPAGRKVAQVPRHQFTLWNKVEVGGGFGVGLGVTYASRSFASISNAVTLPAYTRADAALYYSLGNGLEVQLNVENLLDDAYFPTAHSDNNISPGAPRNARVTLRMEF